MQETIQLFTPYLTCPHWVGLTTKACLSLPPNSGAHFYNTTYALQSALQQ